ncbi:MAG: response regulator [Erysipelotrichaceae bacterium]|nr:response regulator [Erysipelotrichaceae bacterium]
MNNTNEFKFKDIIRNIGTKNVIATLLVFLLTVTATFIGVYYLYASTKESIELQGKVNVVQSAKEYDSYLLVRKNTVMLAGHVVDEMIRENKPTEEILEYMTAESLSIKKSIDMDYTGLYGWINGEYCDGVGWVPDDDYVATERPWYTETMADNSDVTFVRPYIDDQTGSILTTMAEKLSDGVSVIALDVTLDRIQQITEEIALQSSGSYGMVLDKTGLVIAHSDKSEIGKNYLEETDTLYAKLAEIIYSGDENNFELEYGEQKYVAFVENIEGGWQAVSLVDTNIFYQPLKIIMPLLGILTVLEGLIFMLVILNQTEKNLAIASAKEAQSANQAKTRFLSQMSHEIRTPINAIIGLDSIVLRDEKISSRTRESLEKIGTSARHLLSIVNDILDMSRIESGRMVLKEEIFSFRELIDQINTIIGGQCDDKRLNYVCNRIEPLDDYFSGDNLKLKQIIINILGNSVKFTDSPGTITFSVRQENISTEQAKLLFTMEDTGIGMDKEFIPKLFDAFTQENTANTSQYGGSGLGMAITKNIVEMMGGEINVESEKGKGTVFTVTVILKRAKEEEYAASQESPIETASLKGCHLLIAEDQEMNAEVLSDLIELEDMTSEWAQNGKLAIEMFEKNKAGHFDAILMDMRMPVMDGISATQEIRKLDRPDARMIPIIALTANAFEEDVKQCLQAGMNAHLSKPVNIDLLKKTLSDFLGEK